MSRWQRYWFAEGGRHALAIVRIAVATSVLLSLARLATHPQLVAPAGLYRPIGLWMLVGDTPPPPLLVELLWGLAWVGAGCMLLGLATRVTTAVGFVAAVALASLSFSGSATWSHQYNVVFLAQLALLGARSGDALSLDALVRRLRGLPALDVPGGYQWSLRLVQLAVGLMFVGAVFHKLLHGHLTLRWALSDNLRHHLLVKYDLAGLARPPLVDWLIDDVWRYRTAAVLNMITQLVPLFAIVFVRRPWVRAVAAVGFVTEVIALGLVVDLWNLHWLPLAAVFLDWDRVIAAVWRRLGKPPRPPPSVEELRLPRAPRRFILGFVAFDVLTAFIPTLDQRLGTYPFSGFPMFATIRATPPYDAHQPYVVAGDAYAVTAARPLEPYAQAWFDHTHRHLHTVRDPARVRAKLVAVVAAAQQRFPGFGITGARHQIALFVAPAYPAPAHFERHPIAITGELSPDGTFRSVLGRWTDTTVELRPQGLDTTGARLGYYTGASPELRALPATRAGDVFTLAAPVPAEAIYVVAVIGEDRWLVASRRLRN